MKKRIAILGSTGSIGTQALDVIRGNPNHFDVEVLTAYNNVELLINQAKEFKPNTIMDPDFSRALSDAFEAGVGIHAYDCSVSSASISSSSTFSTSSFFLASI